MLFKKNYKINMKMTSGFTITEVLVSIFIISILTVSVGTFAKDIFSLNSTLSGNMNTQLDARHVLRVMVTELRKASQSSLGAYPISLASTSAVTFYSDVDSDGIKDRVRYFLSSSSIKKGVVVPTGNPSVYNDANEKITTIISGVISSSTSPLFQYYPSSYSGGTSALSYPVHISLIRLIKITVIIDRDPGRSPVPMVVTSQVSIRNLKDNL